MSIMNWMMVIVVALTMGTLPDSFAVSEKSEKE